jgi:hypothetical protein
MSAILEITEDKLDREQAALTGAIKTRSTDRMSRSEFAAMKAFAKGLKQV